MTSLDTSLVTLEKAAVAEAKPLLQSRTIWALAFTFVALMANKAGAHIADTQVEQVVDLVTSFLQGGGITAAALSRVVAKGPLK